MSLPDPHDAAMPTVENVPPSRFQPGQGIINTDVLKITLMCLLQLTCSGAEVAPGPLQHQLLNPTRVAQLSPEAQRWMVPLERTPTS